MRARALRGGARANHPRKAHVSVLAGQCSGCGLAARARRAARAHAAPARRCQPARADAAVARARPDDCGWASPSKSSRNASVLVLDAVGAAATHLRRTSSMRPVTPTLEGWGEASPRAAMSISSGGSGSSLPCSLPQELGASPLSYDDVADVDALRGALAQMRLRLAESDSAASALAAELGCRDQGYSDHLAAVQNSHQEQLAALENNLRAEARGAMRRSGSAAAQRVGAGGRACQRGPRAAATTAASPFRGPTRAPRARARPPRGLLLALRALRPARRGARCASAAARARVR